MIFCFHNFFSDAGTPAVTYDYGYGRTYDTTKTYYQQTTATYAAPAQPYDASTQSAAKVCNFICFSFRLCNLFAKLISHQ